MDELLLLEREQSTMVSSWTEYLCLKQVSENRCSIGIYGYEILGSIYDLVSEKDRNDEDGDLRIPESVNGVVVRGIEDGEYLTSHNLVVATEGSVEFDSADLLPARSFCEENGWDLLPEFMVTWNHIAALTQLSKPS